MSLRQMLKRCGYPEYKKEEVIWDFEQVRAMLGFIERGPVLEKRAVRRHRGCGLWNVCFRSHQGVGNHAVLSHGRSQGCIGSGSPCIAEAERIAKDPEGITVATVGKINVSPNCLT